tara:strand:+ start:474 stop:668 length:195 start_codon:yes stop_codon:yes gene_type:complete
MIVELVMFFSGMLIGSSITSFKYSSILFFPKKTDPYSNQNNYIIINEDLNSNQLNIDPPPNYSI